MALGPSAEKYIAKIKIQTEKFEQIIDKEIDSKYTGGGNITISLPESPYPDTKEKLMQMYTATNVGWKSVKFSQTSQYNETSYVVTLSIYVVRETTNRGNFGDH